MQPLNSENILWLKESVSRLSHPEKAVWILYAAGLGPPDDIFKWHIGFRDAALLRLRMATFGNQISCVDICPGCSNSVEMNIHIPDILTMAPTELKTTVTFPEDNGIGEIKLPTSEDIEFVLKHVSPENAQTALIQRCFGNVSTKFKGSEAELDSVESMLEEHDPFADIHFSVDCPECKHAWDALFDIVSIFWKEIVTAAKKLLSEVHVIASVYHWSEAEILALSQERRSFYLECIYG